MTFENKPFDTAQKKAETPEKKRLFEVLTKIFNYDTTFAVEDNPGKITAKIDMVAKKADIIISPEGIKAACKFLDDSGAKQNVKDFFAGADNVLKKRLEKYLNDNKK